MTMNNVRQIFQNRFTNIGVKLKVEKNEDMSNCLLPSYTENLYQSAKLNKEICSDIYKKMANTCVLNYNVQEDKKTKKNQWETLSVVVNDSEKKLNDDILTKEIFSTSVKAFDDLARNTKEFEKSISTNVIKYFQELSEDNSLSNIKKTITTLSKDMKANTDRVQNLQEQVNNQTGESTINRKSMDISNIGSTENKLVNAQLAEENSEKELYTKKDLFLSKLFCSEAEKLIIADKMLEFFKEHLEYYIECKNILTRCIPEIQTIIDNNKKNHVFHLPLEDHVASTNRKLSYVLETCIQELDKEETLQEEGLFRISGSKSKLELLKNALNVMRVDECIIKSCDSAVFAGVLKQYLRELPIPLMTFSLYDKWCEVGNKIKQNEIEEAKLLIKECLSLMPQCYYDNFVYLMTFLKKIAENEAVNKMNSSNLALMMGPNLIRNKSTNVNDDSDASRVMMLGSPGPGVLDFIITFFYEIFPDVPVYTASKPIVYVKSPSAKHLELDKPSILKSPRSHTDNDSLSSAELLSEDSSFSYNDNCNSKQEQSTKPSKDAAVSRPKMPRKPPAPPPPMHKASIPEIEIEPVIENLKLRESLDNRPKVKKRTSILEKSITEKSGAVDTISTDSQPRRPMSTANSFKCGQPPVPIKKPNFLPGSEITEKSRSKIESAPPKRPNNPPPPIPSFDKLKETLDQKNTDLPSSKVEPKNTPAYDISKSVDIDPDSATAPVKTHQYSSSDTNHQSTLF